MSDRPLPQTPQEDANPWTTPDLPDNTFSTESEHRNISSSISPPTVPSTELYYCHYSEDDDNPQFADDSMADYHVFGEQDLTNSNLNLVDNIMAQAVDQPEHQSSSDDLGRDSPAATIAISSGTDEGNDILKSVSTRETRASRFQERLSLDDITIPSSMFTSTESQDTKKLTKLNRIFYLHVPWILRFAYIFVLANWWSLIPLMKLSSPRFHAENLPIIYSCAMLALIATSLGLQVVYFKLYGSPWTRRRRAKEAQDAESSRVGDRQPDFEKKIDKKERVKTGVEIYILVVDIILLALTIAVLIISIVMAKSGAVEHDGAAQQQRWKTSTRPNVVTAQETAVNSTNSGAEEEWHRIPIGMGH
ncbi:hypothetical protein TWF694_009159 [Orbilia ellipsospora]|uniref:Uncharacterized protein n=1 Tax=Orbilia ellipsospora TaxID=2528407 RepID=A0AAV9XEM3_9PEZI